MCALVATRTDGELSGMLAGDSLADFDLSFFSSSTAPQFLGHLLATVGAASAAGCACGVGARAGWLEGAGGAGLLAACPHPFTRPPSQSSKHVNPS